MKEDIMKKIFLFAGVLFLFSATSCKKDYTCSCTGYESTSGSLTITVSANDYPIENAKKKDAEDACAELHTTYSAFGASCSLK